MYSRIENTPDKILKRKESCKKYYQEHRILKPKEFVLDLILQRDKNIVIDKKSGIYSIRCCVDSKMYIGSSKNLGRRFQHHKNSFIKNINSPHLQNAWNKYGKDNFIFEIVEFIDSPSIPVLREREQYWMDYYKSYDPEKGYNICKKADGSEFAPRTKEHKEKISSTLKTKYALGELTNAFLGHKHTEAYKTT